MKRKYCLISLALLIGILPVCHAQNAFQPGLKSFPYELNNYREAGLMALGTAIIYSGAWSQRVLEPLNAAEISQLDVQQVPVFERWTTEQWNPRLNDAREFLEPATVLATLASIGGIGLREKAINFSWYPLMSLTMMYFEGFYLAQGSMLLAKSTFKRPRPYTYNQELELEQRLSSGNNESFFSGNATVLFFNATFLSQILDDLFANKTWTKYVWFGSHGLAALSGIWSVQSGMHFPTDVLMGALVGTGTALLITRIHKPKQNRIKLTPWTTPTHQGLALTLSF